MDLRTGITGKTPNDRCSERSCRVEKELGVDLSHLTPANDSIGHADEKNCEQMLGHVPIPVGYAGPLSVSFSSGQTADIHLPLATTEGALVASVNRGCKALSACVVVKTASIHHGISRSIAFTTRNPQLATRNCAEKKIEWIAIAESTSSHLKILRYDVDTSENHLFLTLFCDTDEAMGMNMVTIAAQKVGEWIQENIEGMEFITVAGNVDSDKKPSQRVHDRGRGYEVTAEVTLTEEVIRNVLKYPPEALLAVAEAKLKHGSQIAGAIGSNLHAANIIAALYLATGQDAAHVVEGSLTDTAITKNDGGILIRCHLPALLIGTHGGGTSLPAQSQCLTLLLKSKP